MNTATSWSSKVISDNEIEFTSDTTFGGSKYAKATFTDGAVSFSTDDVPHFVIERAHRHFGI